MGEPMKTEKKILDNGKYNTSEDKLPFMTQQFPKYLSSHTNSSFFLDTLSNEVNWNILLSTCSEAKVTENKVFG